MGFYGGKGGSGKKRPCAEWGGLRGPFLLLWNIAMDLVILVIHVCSSSTDIFIELKTKEGHTNVIRCTEFCKSKETLFRTV
jgi:hypothetical protein